jgi:glycosyltransferase involved in cell wall biosynthesis
MLSVVMPLLNNLEYTKQAVDSLISCTKEPLELIFVDDCSKDGTQDYIRKHSFANKKIHLNSAPLGVTKNWNRGIQLSTGEFIVIANNDIVFTDGWDVPLIKAISEGATLASPYHTRYGLPADFPKGSERISNNFPILGACFMSRRDLYDRIGLFPEQLVLWFNDTWLVKTVEAFGGRFSECSDSYIHHYYSKTISQVANLVQITNGDAERFNVLKIGPQ